ncbi:unnamed protein product [Alopecurus aequalis]
MTKLLCIFLLLVICSFDNVSTTWCHRPYLWGEIQSKTASSFNMSLISTSRPLDVYNHMFTSLAYTSFPDVITKFYGASATLDVYESSSASDGIIATTLIVANYEEPHTDMLNEVRAGWNIQPSYYGDNKTHFIIGWTADGYVSTGCFDLKCNGFVLVKNPPIAPGDTLPGKSKISFKIFKSKDSGDWWLHFAHAGQKFAPVGYWPQSLFNSLKFYSNYVTWGGHTTTYGNKLSPPMGNGYWPGPQAASFQDMKYVNEDESSYRPGPVPGLQPLVTHKECYQGSDFLIDHFSYGGPGGCTN